MGKKATRKYNRIIWSLKQRYFEQKNVVSLATLALKWSCLGQEQDAQHSINQTTNIRFYSLSDPRITTNVALLISLFVWDSFILLVIIHQIYLLARSKRIYLCVCRLICCSFCFACFQCQLLRHEAERRERGRGSTPGRRSRLPPPRKEGPWALSILFLSPFAVIPPPPPRRIVSSHASNPTRCRRTTGRPSILYTDSNFIFILQRIILVSFFEIHYVNNI